MMSCLRSWGTTPDVPTRSTGGVERSQVFLDEGPLTLGEKTVVLPDEVGQWEDGE